MTLSHNSTINRVSQILGEVIKEVLSINTGTTLRIAPTLQKLEFVALRPDIAAFVEFNGDYNGLLCMNFSHKAALELYRTSMLFLGVPESEIATDPYSNEVTNFVGEMVNQIIGNFRKKVENIYGLSATNHQPRAIPISHTIVMYINTLSNAQQCRRLCFRTQDGNPFYAEISLEQMEFIPIETKEDTESSAEDLLKELF